MDNSLKADSDPTLTEIVIFLVVVFLFISLISWARRKLGEHFEKKEIEKQHTLLLRNLTAEFPKYSHLFTGERAEAIFRGEKRRDQDLVEEMRKNRDLYNDLYVFPMGIYMVPSLGQEFADFLEDNSMNKKRFHVAVYNAEYEGSGSKQRLRIDETGKVQLD